MKRTISLNRTLFTFGLPLSIFGFLILLIRSSVFAGSNTLSLAITADLLLTVPFIYYLLIRKSDIPSITIMPVMVTGVLIGSYFLPQENQSYLTLFKTWMLPLVEVSVVTVVLLKVRATLNNYKKVKNNSLDFFSALKNACYEALPKIVAMPVATEIAVIYYGFINWTRHELRENEFSYHKKSGSPALFLAFILMIAVECFAFHLLLAQWNLVVAWVLTILSAYTAVQLYGFARSLSKRPIVIAQDTLSLRYGILSEVDIPFDDIDRIELSRKSISQELLAIKMSPLGELENHNVIIYLKRENQLIGFYGIKKKFGVLAIHIDKPIEFKEKMLNLLCQTD